MGRTRPLFVYFRSFSHDKYSTNLTVNNKSIVIEIQTRGRRMVGAHKSTELWQRPYLFVWIGRSGWTIEAEWILLNFPFVFFIKMGQPWPLFRLFSVFSNKHYKFLQQICEKCPSSIWCRDSNPRPLARESPPITTRPGLPPIFLLTLLTKEIGVCQSSE